MTSIPIPPLAVTVNFRPKLGARAAGIADDDRVDALRNAGQIERRRQLRERVERHRAGRMRRAGHR